jgi:hypothetical protein
LEYSEVERDLLRAPSVEDNLCEIRKALALNTLLLRALSETDDLGLAREVEQDATAAMADMCASLWSSAQALIEALPAEICNLHVVAGDDDDDRGGDEPDHEGGAAR